MGRIERGEEREHFCRVPAAAEEDENVNLCPEIEIMFKTAVEGGEDVDETEL